MFLEPWHVLRISQLHIYSRLDIIKCILIETRCCVFENVMLEHLQTVTDRVWRLYTFALLAAISTALQI